jgi:hypothetical protein
MTHLQMMSGHARRNKRLAMLADGPLGQSLAVVANGPILDPNLGSFIDGHDRVIRFNRYETEGYEKAMGSKTTDWVLLDKLITLRQLDQFKRVLVRCNRDRLFQLHMTICRTFGFLKRGSYQCHKSLKYPTPRLPKSLYYIYSEPHEVIPEARRLYPMPFVLDQLRPKLKGGVPSTGLLGLIMLIRYGACPEWFYVDGFATPVKLIGYGPRDRLINCHYFDGSKRKSIGGLHNYDAERELINEWEKECLVERCDV